VLHEQNAVPGLANRVLARRARTVALSFAEAGAKLPASARVEVTGNPVRGSMVSVRDERPALTEEALEAFDLEPGRRTLVVFGGSQGARNLNVATVGALRRLTDRGDLQVLLLTGPTHAASVHEALDATGTRILVRVEPFLARMELAYALADLVVARAGATTCAEVAVCGVPSILVPYPYATANHQEANARALERAGASVVLLDASLSAEALAETVGDLLDDDDRRHVMAERAGAWARPDAAAALAALVRRAGAAT
jgi:UDP-N-acetylglucosamine--N-acetylmuramyl-(pentapeptide) pyrophosphoryl-undecaprenol N-acetylglucosamine transferase